MHKNALIIFFLVTFSGFLSVGLSEVVDGYFGLSRKFEMSLAGVTLSTQNASAGCFDSSEEALAQVRKDWLDLKSPIENLRLFKIISAVLAFLALYVSCYISARIISRKAVIIGNITREI